MLNVFKEAAQLVISGHASIEDVVIKFDIPKKTFKKYIFNHKYHKIMDMPIILFDLNGTLCHRMHRNNIILLRPHIEELKKLKKKYRVGVYTSCVRYNALVIIRAINKACGEEVFDPNLIFTREHNVPFTDFERLEYNIPDYQMKKSLSHIFIPKVINKTYVVDDEDVRVEEKDRVKRIPGWYNDNDNDTELITLIDALLAA